ncbi:EF-hand domain, partial [Dillenia turbinata]
MLRRSELYMILHYISIEYSFLAKFLMRHRVLVEGTSHPCPAFKSLSNKVADVLCWRSSLNKYKNLDAKLESKVMEIKRGASGQKKFRSFNSIILKFPQYKEGLRNIRSVFDEYDEDSNGAIDFDEFNKCLNKLQVHLTDKEAKDLYDSCDIDNRHGIQFNEFIVLLCLVYLLMEPFSSTETISRIGSPELEATFNTIIETFLFLDKNGDGRLNKKDIVQALHGSSPQERSPAHVNRNRFREIDWNRRGKVSFREFLFSFIDWVGFDMDNEN